MPHRADKDLEVGEYVIPKGATILVLLRGMMYDPKVSTNKNFPYGGNYAYSILISLNVIGIGWHMRKNACNLLAFDIFTNTQSCQ